VTDQGEIRQLRHHSNLGRVECVSGVGPSQREWAATVHVLAAPAIVERAAAFIDPDRRVIGWASLLEASLPWSAAERLLIDAALDLWDGERSTSLYDAVTG
jgi:hypothetical protein